MCLAIPGKIIELKNDGENAVVDFNGIIKDTNISLVKDAVVGDYLIVHAGFAIQKLVAQDAEEILKMIEKLPPHEHPSDEDHHH